MKAMKRVTPDYSVVTMYAIVAAAVVLSLFMCPTVDGCTTQQLTDCGIDTATNTTDVCSTGFNFTGTTTCLTNCGASAFDMAAMVNTTVQCPGNGAGIVDMRTAPTILLTTLVLLLLFHFPG